MNTSDLEHRMYGLVPYNLSPIQQGIQFGHAVQEYNNNMAVIPLTDEGDTQFDAFNKWRLFDKTFIILNGGTTNKRRCKDGYKGSINNHLKMLSDNNIFTSSFYEPDLGEQLTAVVFLVDERVFNKTKYPDFEEWIEKQDRGTKMMWMSDQYDIWLDFIGGRKNKFLREFLKQFRLA